MSKVTKFFRGKVRSINPKDFTAEVVITDETPDRYKEIVRVDAIKKAKASFMEHPVMLSSHNYRGLLNQIGHYEKIKVDEETKEVIARPKWYVGEGNPEADWGWKLAEKGIAAFSIGFISKKYHEFDEDEKKLKENKGAFGAYEELELLEVSQVLIPANPSALQKSFDDATEPEEKDFIQEIIALCAEYHAAEKKEEQGTVSEAEEQGAEKNEPVIVKFEGSVDVKNVLVVLNDLKAAVSTLTALVVDAKAYSLQVLQKMEEEVRLTPLLEKTANEQLADAATATVITALDLNAFAKLLKDHATFIEGALLQMSQGKETPAPVSDDVIEEKDTGVDDLLSEEKLNELETALRMSLAPDAEIDVNSVRAALDQMTEEVSRVFSSQPKGNGQES